MNPYSALPEKHFWSPAVGKREPEGITQLWNPKRIVTRNHKISTYGSCFAQYFGQALKARSYQWMNHETAPEELSEESKKQFNYGIFSSRTANIYTTSLLRQWTEWSLGIKQPPTEVWCKNGRFYDPFRPLIEPDGFASEQELYNSRELVLEAFRNSFTDCGLFVFTLGLTECWKNTNGYEYPMCPGTVGGEFDANVHQFHNLTYKEIEADLRYVAKLMASVNPKIRFLLTVSPVPLTATMSGKHVLTATVHSKSVLRAVAGELAENSFYFDYFPSYEIISSTPFQGMYYQENKRSVRREGVDFVMNCFFECMQEHFNANPAVADKVENKPVASINTTKVPNNLAAGKDSPVCEEELLGAFHSAAPKRGAA